MAQHFDKDYVKFMKDLAANNNREWFHENKKRYEKSVKEPFTGFVQELIDKVAKLDKDVKIEPKQAIFRIHRDVRFGKDKTPYKTNMSAVLSAGGRKDMIKPGMYVELGPEDVRVYGGLYMLDTKQLYSVRTYLSKNLKEFNKLLNAKKFKETFETIRGEQHKKIPKDFADAIAEQPLILNKSFYYFVKLKPTLIAKPELVKTVMDHYKISQPMNEFLAKALK